MRLVHARVALNVRKHEVHELTVDHLMVMLEGHRVGMVLEVWNSLSHKAFVEGR